MNLEFDDLFPNAKSGKKLTNTQKYASKIQSERDHYKSNQIKRANAGYNFPEFDDNLKPYVKSNYQAPTQTQGPINTELALQGRINPQQSPQKKGSRGVDGGSIAQGIMTALGAVASVLPNKDSYFNPYQQEMTYTPNSQGTGSQAIYNAGGNPGDKPKPKPTKRKKVDSDGTPLNPHVNNLLDLQSSYINSDTYKRRLKGSGITNPDEIVKSRLNNLNKVRVETGGSAMASYYAGEPFIQLPLDATPETVIHEISHLTNEPGVFDAVNKASGKSISSGEAWKFINKANFNPDLKNQMWDIYANDVRQFNQYGDPSERIAGDPHDIGVGEAKSDLDSLRLLLFRNKLTKSYGEDITPETLKKAAQIDAIKNEPHYQRLIKKYDVFDLTDLNNTVAGRKSSQSSLAKSGMKMKGKKKC